MLSVFMLSGAFSGLMVASWHGFKDSPWEGFVPLKFPRSIIIAVVISVLMCAAHISGILKFDSYGAVILSVICIERFIGELHKAFIRREWHDEYRPLFHLLGMRRELYVPRIICGCIGLVCAVVIFFFFLGVPNQLLNFFSYKLLVGICSGLIGGIAVAIGGAIKDAPSEGFQFERFFVSPIIGLVGGAFLVSVMKTPDLLIASSIGFERMVNEFHKTFCSGKNRRIFDGKMPLHVDWFHWRWIFFIPCSLVIMITFIGLALHI